MKILRHCLDICFVSAFLATALFAQAGQGSIEGYVTDPAGGAVPNASIYAAYP
jgi:hypothetical protein